MSPNAPGSPEPNLARTAPAPAQEFDLLAFWIQYRRLVIRLFVVALLAVAIYGAWLFWEYHRRAGSEEALGNAKSAADFRKVTVDWAGTPAAGTACLRLAEELRKEDKPADAAQALREFLDEYPAHPLRIPAAHALASSLETAGKFDEALTAYQNFANAHGRSAFAPLGFVGQARVLTALGQPGEARKVLESIEQKFTGNPLMEEARMLLDEIKNPAARKTGGSPRPAPPPPAMPPPPAPLAPPAPTLNISGTPPPAPAPGLNLEGAASAPQPPAPPAPPMTISPAPAPAPKSENTAPAPAPPPAVPGPAPVPPPPAEAAPATPAPIVPAPPEPVPAAPALSGSSPAK